RARHGRGRGVFPDPLLLRLRDATQLAGDPTGLRPPCLAGDSSALPRSKSNGRTNSRVRVAHFVVNSHQGSSKDFFRTVFQRTLADPEVSGFSRYRPELP